jgi:lysyl-tRNA synthetase class 2
MNSRLDRISQERLASVKRLRSRGLDPYPHSYHPTHTVEEAAQLFEAVADAAPPVRVAGRVMARRKMGKMAFLDLRDRSGKIQLCLRRDFVGAEAFAFLAEVDIGDILGAEGKLFRTKMGEITVDVSTLTMLCKSLRPLPEKWHGLADVEKRYRQRHLDLISNSEVRRIFELRGRIVGAIRDFLDGRGFVEVETPVLQSQAGGALATPFVTHHEALDRDLYLRIALELYLKRLVVGGFDRVYEVGRVFRNEGISTRHNPEFTLLECYQAYADYDDIMRLVEDMVSTVAERTLGTRRIVSGEHEIDLSPPWRRLCLRDAIREHAGIDFEEHRDARSLRERMEAMGLQADPGKDRGRLIDELISTLVEPNLVQPTFLLDYPVEMSPLAKRKRGDERLVERFEAFVNGTELANAFTELNDPVDQRDRFEHQVTQRGGVGDTELADEDFLEVLEYGMPPTGGLGVGLDRLVMLLTGQQSIREVILFPQLKSR